MNSRRSRNQIGDAIEQLQGLRAKMTGRRREVFEKLVGIGTEKDIAKELGMRVNTVHSYTKTIYLILNVHSRQQLRELLKEMEFEPEGTGDNIFDEHDLKESIQA